MFDPKTIEAYRKIKPSDSLRERVLTKSAGKTAPRILTLRKYGNLAACFALLFAVVLLAGGLANTDPNYAVLANGTVLSAEATPIESVTANYTGAARISFHIEDTQAPTYPDPVEVNSCFYFELHADSLTSLTAEIGSVFLYDEELECYVDCGSTAFFEGKCALYWHIPETRDGETYTMIVSSESESSYIELVRANGSFTVRQISDTAKGSRFS